MREKLRKIELQESDTRGNVFNGSHEKYQSILQGSLGRWSEDDERKFEKNSTAKRERERMVFLLVGVRNTMANLLSSLEDGGEDEKTIQKHSIEKSFPFLLS